MCENVRYLMFTGYNKENTNKYNKIIDKYICVTYDKNRNKQKKKETNRKEHIEYMG